MSRSGHSNHIGSCGFNTPLFGKLLEVAKRYGDDGNKNLDSIYYQKLSRRQNYNGNLFLKQKLKHDIVYMI